MRHKPCVKPVPITPASLAVAAAMRRIYLPQYSRTPIMLSTGGLKGMAVPFVADGCIVYDRAADGAAEYGGHA